MKKIIIAITIFITSLSSSYALQYFKVTEGSAAKISEADFDTCSVQVYRNIDQSELSRKNIKRLLKASLRGQVVDSLNAVKKRDGACSYASNSESL